MATHHKASCELVGDIKSQNSIFENGKSVRSIQGEVSSQLSLYHQKVVAKLVNKILETKGLTAEAKAEEIDTLLTEISGYHYRKKTGL